MPADFHWLRPEWLLALPVIAAFAWHSARRRLRPGSWQRVIDPALQPYVLSRGGTKGIDWRWWLFTFGGTIATLALAGPAWERIEQPVYRSEQALVIALDLSRSMDAEDVTPSRLERAKLKVLDILGERESGQTALVVYSSNAFTVTPLTTDTDTIAALVGSVATGIMPTQGSNPAAAIEKSRQLFEQAGARDGEILLITDGGVTASSLQAAEELEEAGYGLSILGVGTLDGAPIPEPGGGFVTDWSGQIAVPKLEARALRSLAEAGGGHFSVMTTDNRDLARLLPSGFGSASAGSEEDLTTDQWRDEGPWLLLLLLPVAALAFRRGWVFAVLVFALPPGQPVHAFEWQDLWRTHDQQARRALADGQAGEAAELFEDPAWRGVAAYRAGNYRESAAAFSGREDADGLYNLGNALAKQGELEAALAAYERALEIDPDDEDTSWNRDLVKKLLEQQQQAGNGQEGRQSQGQQGQGRSAMKDSGQAQDQQGQQGNAAGSQGAQEQGGMQRANETNPADLEALQRELERAAREAAREQAEGEQREAMSSAALIAERRAQERSQALEQWLRRIPDDPGGLLRRKFRYQYQRQGVDQDGNLLWSGETTDPW